MDVSGQSTQTLDQRFFHITGLVLVLGTLVAGAITLWLANDMGETQARFLISATENQVVTFVHDRGGQREHDLQRGDIQHTAARGDDNGFFGQAFYNDGHSILLYGKFNYSPYAKERNKP